jgi:NADH dehydrogenase
MATSVLTPGQIESPIRGIPRNSENTAVILGTVTGVDAQACKVAVDTEDRTRVSVSYDYLILATGVQHSYFGHAEFARYASGPKSLADAPTLSPDEVQICGASVRMADED